MLVLSRHANEGVQIGDEIRVYVLEIRDGRVRLGFEAPREINVARMELLEGVDTLPGGGRPMKPRGNRQ